MKHKLCDYIERHGGVLEDSSQDTRSAYYNFCCRKIRLSDHISKSTSGIEYQVIIQGNNYILYHVTTGTVNICSYKDLKEWIRCFKFFTNYGQTNTTNNATPVIDTRFILGIAVDKFSKQQLAQIESFIKQINKNKK